MALAHADDDEVRGAYNAALYLTPRRRMLQYWADLITGMLSQKIARAAPLRAMKRRCRWLDLHALCSRAA